MNTTEKQLGEGLFKRFCRWREGHVSERAFVLFLAFLVGFFSAVAAFFLHSVINQIGILLTSSFDKTGANWLYLIYPVVGIFLTSLFVRHIVKDNISHGITRILYAISSQRSRLRGHNCWSSVVASGITIGFGGSVGAEAPIVLTGSAIGSNLGKLFHMDNKTLMLLVGCGAAGDTLLPPEPGEPGAPVHCRPHPHHPHFAGAACFRSGSANGSGRRSRDPGDPGDRLGAGADGGLADWRGSHGSLCKAV